MVRFLKWLLSRLEKPEVPNVDAPKEKVVQEEALPGVFSPKERMIFRYFNGSTEVSADPIELYKKVMSEWPAIKTDMTVCTHPAGSNDSFTAHGKMVATIRRIFDIKPLSEGGLLDDECAELLKVFILFAEDVKKNSSLWPTVPEAIWRSSTSVTEDAPPTPNTSASGETENVSATNGPEKSNLGPKLPSGYSPQVSITMLA